MSADIVPVARALYLCDFHVGYHDGKDDLYGVFSTIRVVRFPHTLDQMVFVARLSNGLGDTPVLWTCGTSIGTSWSTRPTLTPSGSQTGSPSYGLC